jgi:hypothetical protein
MHTKNTVTAGAFPVLFFTFKKCSHAIGFDVLLVFNEARAIFLAVVFINFFEIFARKVNALVAMLDVVFLFGVLAIFFKEVACVLSGFAATTGGLSFTRECVTEESYAGLAVDATSSK